MPSSEAFESENCIGRRRTLLSALGTTVTLCTGCLARSGSEAPSESDEDSSGTWAQFGADPQNTGRAEVSGPGADGPQIAWRHDAETPTMNASPVVGDGVVYVPGSGDPGYLRAIETESGEAIWSFEPSGYATSAPALADDTLYVGTWGKQFYALDAETGDPRWQQDIGHRFGTSSPAVVDGTVYVGTIGDGPLVVSGEEDEESFEGPAFLALDADTGEVEWDYRKFGERVNLNASPAVVDGRVYVGSETALLALDAETGSEVWKRTIEAHPDSSPAVVDGVVYYGGPADDGSESPARLWALDAESGETLWTAGIDDANLRTSPAVSDGNVYVAASSLGVCAGGGDCSAESRGQMYAIDRENGERQWTTTIEPDTRSSPAVVDGVIYVGCGNGLSAVTTDGEHQWHVAFETSRDDTPYVDSSPAVADERVFVGASDGRLRAVGLKDSD